MNMEQLSEQRAQVRHRFRGTLKASASHESSALRVCSDGTFFYQDAFEIPQHAGDIAVEEQHTSKTEGYLVEGDDWSFEARVPVAGSDSGEGDAVMCTIRPVGDPSGEWQFVKGAENSTLNMHDFVEV